MKCIKFSGILRSKRIPTRRPDLINKKNSCRLLDFAVPAAHIVKIKESEKIDK